MAEGKAKLQVPSNERMVSRAPIKLGYTTPVAQLVANPSFSGGLRGAALLRLELKVVVANLSC